MKSIWGAIDAMKFTEDYWRAVHAFYTPFKYGLSRPQIIGGFFILDLLKQRRLA
jgi:hypothetical protein